jgi:hypothetical protein
MTKHVVIAGMFAPYTGPEKEVWGCNLAYESHPQLTRLFFMDPLSSCEGCVGYNSFVKDVNELDIPIIMQKHYDEIPNSQPFPIDEALNTFFGGNSSNAVFTSTIAYMWATALLEGYEEITIHRILVRGMSLEYFGQKAALDYFLGLSLGMGVRVNISEDSMIGKPHEWQSGLYGYVQLDNELPCNSMLVNTLKIVQQVPQLATPPHEEFDYLVPHPWVYKKKVA